MHANHFLTAFTKTVSSKQSFSNLSPCQKHMELFLKYIFQHPSPEFLIHRSGHASSTGLTRAVRGEVNGEKKLALG